MAVWYRLKLPKRTRAFRTSRGLTEHSPEASCTARLAPANDGDEQAPIFLIRWFEALCDSADKVQERHRPATMVRIKERYLLVNILYPPETPRSGRQNVASALVVQHQPTVEKLTAQALVKAIRAEAAVLYGDFGAGALEGHLSGWSNAPRQTPTICGNITRLQSSICL